MPINYRDYPANWRSEIVPAILRRAGEVRNEQGRILEEARCEWCGASNHTFIVRNERPTDRKVITYGGVEKTVPVGDFNEVLDVFPGGVRIILTTAHLDRDKTNNDLDNLASLCQRCHLSHDRMAQHVPNRKYGRKHKEQPKLL